MESRVKAPAKSASENNVCLCHLLHVFSKMIKICKFSSIQCGSRSDCFSTLFWVATQYLFQNFLSFSPFPDFRYFPGPS